MMDLQEQLGRIAGQAVPATSDQVTADVARGRRALRRRRTLQRAGASVFAVAALTAAVAYGTADHSTGGAAPPVAAGSRAVVTAHLVAYTGEQPKGFTIDKVPSGWKVQGVDQFTLTIAPVGAADKDPDVFVGKIAIMLQSKDDKSTPTGTAVQVGGKPGVLAAAQGLATGKNLWIKESDGGYLIVQIWDASGWTQAEIVEFGAGIHVQPGAQRGVG